MKILNLLVILQLNYGPLIRYRMRRMVLVEFQEYQIVLNVFLQKQVL